MAPADIIPDILSDAHGHILAGHDGVLKTKERILQSYYWPGMDQDNFTFKNVTSVNFENHLDRRPR
jgi:hypothetical protein